MSVSVWQRLWPELSRLQQKIRQVEAQAALTVATPWSPLERYRRGQVVTYQGGCYQLRALAAQGGPPVEPTWVQLAAPGAPGTPGTPGAPGSSGEAGGVMGCWCRASFGTTVYMSGVYSAVPAQSFSAGSTIEVPIARCASVGGVLYAVGGQYLFRGLNKISRIVVSHALALADDTEGLGYQPRFRSGGSFMDDGDALEVFGGAKDYEVPYRRVLAAGEQFGLQLYTVGDSVQLPETQIGIYFESP